MSIKSYISLVTYMIFLYKDARSHEHKMAVALYRAYCKLEFVISATTFSERVL